MVVGGYTVGINKEAFTKLPKDAQMAYCVNCTERHCCRGICKDVNDYMVRMENKMVRWNNE